MPSVSVRVFRWRGSNLGKHDLLLVNSAAVGALIARALTLSQESHNASLRGYALAAGYSSVEAACEALSGCPPPSGPPSDATIARANRSTLQVTFDMSFVNASNAAHEQSPFAQTHPDGPQGVLELAVLELACILKAAGQAGGGGLEAAPFNTSGVAQSVVPAGGLTRIISATLQYRELCPEPPPARSSHALL